MSDLIDRQAALDAIDTWDKFGCDPNGILVRYDDDKHYVPYVHYDDMVHAIKNLPSAQPKRTEERTETHACDLISRQAAIDALTDDLSYYGSGDERAFGMSRAIGIIEKLPPAEKTQLSGESTTKDSTFDCISRQAAVRWVKTECNPYGKPTLDFESGKKVIKHLEQMPSAQPEIIRCNSCKHWTQSTGKMKGYGLGRCDFHDADLVACNGFCYWAERRTDE